MRVYGPTDESQRKGREGKEEGNSSRRAVKILTVDVFPNESQKKILVTPWKGADLGMEHGETAGVVEAFVGFGKRLSDLNVLVLQLSAFGLQWKLY